MNVSQRKKRCASVIGRARSGLVFLCGILVFFWSGGALAQNGGGENSVSGLLQRGYHLSREGKVAEAEALFLRAYHQEPANALVNLELGVLYVEKYKNCVRGAWFLERSAWDQMAADEVSYEVFDLLMGCYREDGNWSDSIRVVDRMVRRARRHKDHQGAHELLRLRAEMELNSGQHQDALATIQTVIFQDFQDRLSYVIRAHARFYLGRPREALADLRFVRETFGQGDFVNRDIGVILLSLGEESEALEMLERSLRFDGESVETLRWIAFAHQSADQDKRAERVYLRCLVLPGSAETMAEVQNNLSWLYLSRFGASRRLDALELARRAVQKVPEERRGDFYDTLGEALWRVGDREEARRWFWKALQARPFDRETQRRWRWAQEKSGEKFVSMRRRAMAPPRLLGGSLQGAR